MNAPRIWVTAARRAQAQAELIRALGGSPVLAPCTGLDRPAPDAEIASELATALAGRIDVVVLLTGVGTRHMLGAAERQGLGDRLSASLRRARIMVRGRKARAALADAGLAADWSATPAESRVVREALMSDPALAHRRILVQCAAGHDDPMAAALVAAGATVATVHPYRIGLPADARLGGPLVRDALAGRVAAVTFTSAGAVEGFAALCERVGAEPADVQRAGTVVAAIGPVCRGALSAHGISVDVMPSLARIGALHRALADRLAFDARVETPW